VNGVAGQGNSIAKVLGGDENAVIPVSSWIPHSTQQSTSSTSYTTLPSNFFELWYRNDRFDVETGTLVWNYTARFDGGSGETVSSRVYNTADGEAVSGTEVSSSGSFVTEESGWTAYTPTTTANPVNLKIQLKSEPGSNSSQLLTFALTLGVRL
jgi:hypothetical protein